LLADAGAEVVKIEAPEGDPTRRLGPFPGDLPESQGSGLYAYLNWSKKGVTLDLKSSTGRGLLRELLVRADILVTDYPLVLVESLELTYEALRAANPGLIACAITPFGMTGEHRYWRSDDLIALSVGGIAAATPGFPDFVVSREEEGPLRPQTCAAGIITGAAAAVGILEGVFARLFDGMGRQVDVSQQEALVSTLVRDIASFSYAEIVSGRRTQAEQSGTAYAPNIYLPCKDGMVVLICASEEMWKRLVEVMGSPVWASRAEFRDSASRSRTMHLLVPLLVEWTMQRTGAEITEMTQVAGLPCAHVLRVREVVESAHVRERSCLVDIQLRGQACQMPGPPFRIAGVFGELREPAPNQGKHNRDVWCGSLERPEADLPRLRALGVI
jgi:crotonobetainyl-CoA:carnitine CoA-transferase CaiB-like acyl-CoA transferase